MKKSARPAPAEPPDPQFGAGFQGPNDPLPAEFDYGNSGGFSGVDVWRPQFSGTLRTFNDQKGFGFIECQAALQAFGRDVFIHRQQFQEARAQVGMEVIFEVDLNKNGQPQARRVRPNVPDFNGSGAAAAATAPRGAQGKKAPDLDPVEELLRSCASSSAMWDVVEQHGHSFGKRHVVTALYQLGLCRQYERGSSNQASLTAALVDRLVLFPPRELTAHEASRVLWSLAVVEEVGGHKAAHKFAVALGEEAARRAGEFSPSQMASFVSSLSRLVRSQAEDELVGRVTTNFSDYALGSGTMPRFPPEELRTWTKFLEDASAQAVAQQQPQGPHPGFVPPGYGPCTGAVPTMGIPLFPLGAPTIWNPGGAVARPPGANGQAPKGAYASPGFDGKGKAGKGKGAGDGASFVGKGGVGKPPGVGVAPQAPGGARPPAGPMGGSSAWGKGGLLGGLKDGDPSSR